MLTYKTIINIQLHHEFFERDSAGELSCVLSRDSERTLRNYRMQYRPTKTGCMILYEYRKQDESIIPTVGIDKPIQLRFYVKVNNPYFHSFTNLPFDTDKRKALYFINASASGEPAGDLMQGRASVSVDDYETVVGKSFNYKTEKRDAKLITVVDRSDQTVFEKFVENPERMTIDLTDEPEGWYALKEDYKETVSFFTTASDPTAFVGYIDVVLTKEGVQQQQESGYEFDLKFKAREVFWQYVVIAKSTDKSDFKITDEAEGIEFTEEGRVSDVSGERISFRSSKKIKVKEKYKFNFSLVDADGSRTFIEQLPYPKIENFKDVAKESDDYCLEAFVVL